MPQQPMNIVGSYLSPYVRKVLACLHLKGIEYRIDPIIPFYGNEEFAKISPIRRIPVLLDEGVSLCDSTVICEYLEEKYPSPNLYPTDRVERARARWLEEYADSRMGDVFIWRYWNQLVIKRFVWGEEPDEAAVKQVVEQEIPQILDYLEAETPVGGSTFFGTLGVADLAVATFFRNAELIGFGVDSDRWPGVAAFVDRTLGHDCFARLKPFEDLSMRTSIAEHRRALAEAGAPVSPESFATTTPRRGVFDT
jgi:glutathione S-transferase